jgi:HEAT repeat protein
MEFSGDNPQAGRHSLRVSPPGAPSPGGPYSLLLQDKTTGVERELVRFAVHVDVSWSRDATQLAVTDLGDGHRGKAFLFDLSQGDDVVAIDLGEKLQRDKPETAVLFHREDVNVIAQSWQPETGWIVQVVGIGPDYPRGFTRWYPFKPESGFGSGGGGPRSLGLGEKDYDAPYFEAAKIVLIDRGRSRQDRLRALREVVMRDARRGLAILATLLDDRDEAVRDLAAEYLAIRGDRRGLEIVRGWLSEPGRAFRAAQRLGNSGRKEYAEPIATRIRSILYPSVARGWDAENRAFLRYGTIALARLSRPEDRGLIFEVARIDDSRGTFPLSALGFVDDPRSRELLWRRHEESSKRGFTRARIEALLALSRLGEPAAIEMLKRILRDRKGWWLPNSHPLLTEERAIAFESLRPRDATTFAETVFEVAAQDPEGPGTFEAWETLGVMHPAGFGRRVLKLAWSRRPHWKTVAQHRLNTVLIAIDPDLNSLFWSGYETERVPAMNSEKALVRVGFSALMFAGSWYWIGE